MDIVRAIFEWYVRIFNAFMAVYLIVYATYLLICAFYGSIKTIRNQRMRRLQNVLNSDFYYPISIIVPEYNEGESGVQTVKNLLKLDYKAFEIVVVDDGSKDNTKQLLVDAFHLKLQSGRPIRYSVKCQPIQEVYVGKSQGISITLISKVNGGKKADAVNAGINVANYPYFVNMDGDEILQKDALLYASRAILEEDDVIGVGGNLKISNGLKFNDAMPTKLTLGKNLIADMQVLEYSRSFIGSKMFQNVMNANLIISGGYGVFKKDAVIEIGGFDVTSMGEDMEITMHLHEWNRKHKRHYVMKYSPDSICFTQGPDNFKDLKKQRERWHCGLIQNLTKYRHMILNPKYGWVGTFMLPYVILYEFLAPWFMILGVIAMIASASLGGFHLGSMLIMAGVYFAFNIATTLIAYVDNKYVPSQRTSFKDACYLFFLAFVDSLFFRVILTFVSFFATFKAKKIAKKWESPKRVKIDAGDQ